MSNVCSIPSVVSSRRNLKILVVDDFPINREVICAYLRDFSIACVTVENGKEAVDVISQTNENDRFDAILMDIQMPVLNGYDAARSIRLLDAYRRVPIIAVTSFTMASDKQLCFDVGMNEHIAKPVDFEILREVLEAQLNLSLDSYRSESKVPFDGSSEETFSDLPDELPGFEIAKGLIRFGDSRELYAKLLREFPIEMESIWVNLSDAFCKKDWVAVSMHAHSIKGSAGNIGAARLSAAASCFEQVVNANTRELKDSFNEFKETLFEACSLLHSWRRGDLPAVNGISQFDLAGFQELLEEVESLVVDSSFDAASKAEALTQYSLGSDYEKMALELSDFLSNFDYVSACEKLSDIREILRKETVSS